MKVVVGDITTLRVDAIVNAANSTLLGGGGVDGAIHLAGGPENLRACRDLRASTLPDGLPTGEAVATTAGELPSNVVIHTVGPIYDEVGDERARLLASCYRESLELGRLRRVRSIAFPAISTGVYGYPAAEAANVSSAAIEHYALQHEHPALILLVFFSSADADTFLAHQQFTR